jgi:hypothetical protein
MRFCTECGTSLDQEASKQLFCFNCGAQLSSDHDNDNVNVAPKLPPMPPAAPPVKKEGPVLPRIPQMPPIPGQQIARDTSKEIDSKEIESNEVESKDLSNKRPDTFQNGFDSYGIILTDTRKIAKKCRSTSNDIFNIIKDYTHRLSKYGHQYIIFDYDASRYQNQSWENCVDELSKFYYNQSITPEYLFIIGGDDIIPMPVFDNLSGVEAGDNDYESDVPYSYLETYDVETSIWDGTLYQYEVKLFVGRLPFGEDFEKRHLTSYFDKVINALEKDFRISNCFSLSAQSWQGASEEVLNGLELNQKFIDFSPAVSLNNVDEIFDTSSDILYFNLHGSDAFEQSQFFGDYGFQAIAPKQISNLQNYNIIITEACYGAKFIGYRNHESMLLNSLNKNTLAYIGSSRIAFGSPDSYIASADIIAQSVLRSLSKGYSMGNALSKARIDSLEIVESEYYDDEYDEDGFIFITEMYDEYSLITALEFNLFGEPTLRAMHNRAPNRSNQKVNKVSRIPQKTTREEIYSKNQNQNILDAVRASVDLEFEKISRIIQTELYNRYELTSDELQSISLRKSKSNSNEAYMYVYSKKQNDIKNNKLYFINCSKSGSIKKVITTK